MLINGDRLSPAELHRRYERYPKQITVQLIELGQSRGWPR